MKRAIHGHTTSFPRTCNGLVTDFTRASDGPRAFAGRLSSGRVCVRRLFVQCSVFGRVLCGVRLVLVRVAFVRGGSQGEAADCGRRSVHIRTWEWSLRDTRRTSDGRGRAGIRLMPTFCDIPRWAAARGGWTCHGLATDGRHTDAHGLCTDCTRACLRTTGDGLITDCTRTSNGLQTDKIRTRYGRNTDKIQTDHGRATDCTRA